MGNSIQIEKRAVIAVEEALIYCDILNPDIKTNDKTPSIDGNVQVYKNNVFKKENLIGTVPVQVKGRNSMCDTSTTSHSIDVADLKNYHREKGCILFLVHMDTTKNKKKIYYANLLPNYLETMLHCNKKTKNIKFDEFPEDKKEIENIFKRFLGYVDPNDRSFIHINKAFLEKQQLSEDEAERLLIEYSKINSDPSLILKIVCNDLHTHNQPYDRIVEKIYKKAVSSKAPTFLMAAGGTGKSTLLCSIACYAHTVHGVHVLYSNPYLVKNSKPGEFVNQLKQFLCAMPGLTLLCIDEALKNKDLIKELYSKMERSGEENTLFDNLRILIADRTYWIRDLISNEEHKFSLWTSRSPALLIENTEQDNPLTESDMNIMSNYFSRDRTEKLYFDSEIRRAIIENMIKNFFDLNDLDPECTEQAKKKINLNQKTISDVLLDFRRNYNNAAKYSVRPVTNIAWDWNIWQNKLSDLNIQTVSEEKIPLEETFRYISALTILNVNVSTSLLEKMTGIALKDKLRDRFPQELADPVSIAKNGILRLRHDTVAANYFEINSEQSVNECLKNLIKKELFDEQSLVKFEKKTFSISNFYCDTPSETDVNIYELLHIFNESKNFRRILEKKKRLYSLELALIAADMVRNRNSISDLASYCEKRLNTSFENNFSRLPSNSLLATIWIKYFNFARRNCKKVPSVLLKQLKRDKFFKEATKNIGHMIKNMTVWLPEDQKHDFYSCAADVFKWILDNINQNDEPSRKLLSKIYIQLGEFEKANKLNNKFNSSATDNTVFLEISSIMSMEKNLKKIDPYNPEIINYQKEIVNKCEEVRQQNPVGSSNYITATCKLARYKKEHYQFDETYDLLNDLLKSSSDNPNIYRAYVEFGMLCNTYKRPNKHYNLKTSIHYFNKAWELFQTTNDPQKEAIYILKPLAQTYMSDFQYNNAIDICNIILKYFPRLDEVKRLKDLALELQKRPPNKRPRNWWYLM